MRTQRSSPISITSNKLHSTSISPHPSNFKHRSEFLIETSQESSTMEIILKNSSGEPSKKSTRNRTKTIPSLLFFSLLLFISIFFLLKANFGIPELLNNNNNNNNSEPSSTPVALQPLQYHISFGTSSSVAADSAAFSHFLGLYMKDTIKIASNCHAEIIESFQKQELNAREKAAFEDCLQLFDQTLYELARANDDVLLSNNSSSHSYANLNILLSASMTNERTCIDGFSELDSNSSGFVAYLEEKLRPVTSSIRSCLAIVKKLDSLDQDSWARRMESGVRPWFNKYERRVLISPTRTRPSLVVAADGSGDYRTIGQAVKMAPNMSIFKHVIRIKAGLYRENVEIPSNKVNLVLVGDGMNATVISGSKSAADGFSTFNSATLTVNGDKFIATDLTVENTASPLKRQAVAIRVTSNAAFYRCKFSSHQDTVYAHSLYQLYRECTIMGTIDFIFGNAAAVFQNCLILARKPLPGQSKMITAQGRQDPYQRTGFLILNSTIKAAPDFTRLDQKQTYTFLGRPWRNYSRTIIAKSYLGSLIHPRGWSAWDKYSNLKTVEYVEFMNSGPGSVTKYRVRWGGYRKNYTAHEMAKKVTVAYFLSGFESRLWNTG